jgi:hypothetical protein
MCYMLIFVTTQSSHPTQIKGGEEWLNLFSLRVCLLYKADSELWAEPRRYSNGLWAGRPGFDSQQHCPDRLWAHPVSYPTGTGALSLDIKRPESEADHFHTVSDSKMVEPYLHSHICLHGIMLNSLSTADFGEQVSRQGLRFSRLNTDCLKDSEFLTLRITERELELNRN